MLKFEEYDSNNPRHLATAELLAQQQRKDAPRMLPLNPFEVAGHQLGILAFVESTEEFAGYNAVLTEYPGGFVETGGLFVPRHLRHHGVAHKIKMVLMPRVTQLWPDHQVLAFCNEQSLHLNMTLGFRSADIREVPPEAFIYCRTKCESYDPELFCRLGKICCDHILIREPGLPIPEEFARIANASNY